MLRNTVTSEQADGQAMWISKEQYSGSGQKEPTVQRPGDGRVGLTCLKKSKKAQWLEQSEGLDKG